MQTDFEKISKVLKYFPETGDIYRVNKSTGEIGLKPAGSINGEGYRAVYCCGRHYLCHRIAWLLIYGDWPNGQIDHENHVRNDNRISNLKNKTNQGNQKNRSLSTNNTSGHCGVSFSNSRGKWMASISTNNKDKYLGYFDVLEDAVKARKQAEKYYGYHENHGAK